MDQVKIMNHEKTAVKMILDRWFAQTAGFDETLSTLSDPDLYREIAPGKNRGIYLLGHLVAVHDDISPLLNFGEKMYPHIAKQFIKAPDIAEADYPSPKALREYWSNVNKRLEKRIRGLSVNEWFERHSAISPEAFSKEPHRNKLNIIVNRTSHLSHHLGQFILLKT